MHSRTPTSTPLPYTAPFRSEPGSRDPSRRRSGEETSPAAEEIIDDVLEARVFVTRIAVDKNDAETIAFFLHQGEIGRAQRLNSSHANISYAVFCLKKKKKNT